MSPHDSSWDDLPPHAGVNSTYQLSFLQPTPAGHIEEFPAQRAGLGGARFQGAPAILPIGSSPGDWFVYCVTTDGRIVQLQRKAGEWTPEYLTVDDELRSMRFAGSVAALPVHESGAREIYAMSITGRLVRMVVDDRVTEVGFPAEMESGALRFAGSPAAMSFYAPAGQRLVYAITTDGVLVELQGDRADWHLVVPADEAEQSDVRFRGSPSAALGRATTDRVVKHVVAIATDHRLLAVTAAFTFRSKHGGRSVNDMSSGLRFGSGRPAVVCGGPEYGGVIVSARTRQGELVCIGENNGPQVLRPAAVAGYPESTFRGDIGATVAGQHVYVHSVARNGGVVQLRAPVAEPWIFTLPLSWTATTIGQWGAGGADVEDEPGPLPSERRMVDGLKRRPAVDARYLKVTVEESSTLEMWNTRPRTTLSVSIVGLEVVFEAGHADRLFERFADPKDSALANVKRLTIYADVIEIRTPIRFAQTHVTLMARELRFVGEGSLDTTPIAWEDTPDALVPGANGLSAGDVDLFVGQLVAAHSDRPRLRLNGAAGQKGGAGRSPLPEPDPSKPRKPKAMATFDLETNACWLAQWLMQKYTVAEYRDAFLSQDFLEELKNAVYVTYYKADWVYGDMYSNPQSFESYNKSTTTWPYPETHFGEKDWPEDGIAAEAAARPGDGGDGGTLRTNLGELAAAVEHRAGDGGSPGVIAAGGPPSMEHPVHAALFFAREGKSRMWGTITERRTLVAGATPRAPTADAGNSGALQLAVKDDGGGVRKWLHAHAVRVVARYAADLFLTGHRDEARAVIDPYLAELRRLRDIGQPADSDDGVEFESLLSELLSLRARLDSTLDYFGNPAGWVPTLAFTTIWKSYNDDVERSIRMLYLAYWIRKKWATATASKQTLEHAIKQLNAEIAAAVADIAGAKDELVELETEMSIIGVQIGTHETQLAQIDKDIRESTQLRETAKRGLRLGVGVLAAACKLVPAYQPALGTVGDAASILAKIDPENPFDVAGDVSDVFAGYAALKLSERAAKLTEAAPDPLTKDATEAKRQAANLASVSGRLGPACHDVLDGLKQARVSKDDLDAAVERVQNEDPRFIAQAAAILKLSEKKAEIVDRISGTLDAVGTSYSTIAADLLAIDKLARQRDGTLAVLDPGVWLAAQTMEQHAGAGLLEGRYLLTKAYEHLLVKPYDADYGLEHWFELLEPLLASNTSTGTLDQQQFNALRGSYDIELGAIARSIRSELANSGIVWDSGEHTYRLTETELDVLNSNQPLSLDMLEKGLLTDRKEDQRLIRFGVLTSEGGKPGIETAGADDGTLTLTFRLGTSGTIRRKGRLYAFDYADECGETRWSWVSEYDIPAQKLTNAEPSVAADSLIASLTGDDKEHSDKFANYARPAAWTTIGIELVRPKEHNIRLTRLTLAFRLSYANAPPSQRMLDVRSVGARSPIIDCAPKDLNERGAGIAPFVRLFTAGDSAVLTAPDDHGGAKFTEWRTLIAGAEQVLSTHPQLVLPITDDHRVWPVYTPHPA